jgi:hypothetical protein
MDLGPWMGKKSGSEIWIRSTSGMDNPDHISESLENNKITILQFFDAVPGSGMEKIRIQDKRPGSATLV